MKSCLLFLLFAAPFFSGCNKHEQPPAEPPVELNDARSVLLKDIQADHLPNPYYHFEYDSLHFAKRISFASDYYVYDVEYANNRVKKMTNLLNHNTLVYEYDNGRVAEIDEYSGLTGNIRFVYNLTYNSSEQLTQLDWIRYSDSGESFNIKKAVLAYQSDGNLSAIDWYWADSTGNLKWLSRDEFSEYDNGTNVNDFTSIKSFFDSYLYLPQVRLQKNNPLKEHVFSAESDFAISNTFEYRGDLPVLQKSVVIERQGTKAPTQIEVATHFTYY